MMEKVWESEGFIMAAIISPIEKPSANGFVSYEVSIEDFFEQSIDQMSEQQLQDFDVASEKVISASRKRTSEVDAVGVAHETAR